MKLIKVIFLFIFILLGLSGQVEAKVVLVENEKVETFSEYNLQGQIPETKWLGLLYLQEEPTNQNQILFSRFSSGSLSQNFSEGLCLKGIESSSKLELQFLQTSSSHQRKWEEVDKVFIGYADLVNAWKKLDDDLGDLAADLRKTPEALDELKYAIDEGLDGIDAIEDAAQTVQKSKPTWDEIKTLFKKGNDFNRKGRLEYSSENVEIVLGNGKRLDTYIPGEKIISRKATNIDNIQESTWRNYCNELVTKYKRGTEVNSTKMPGEPPLSGDYFLEIPASNQTASKLADFRRIAQDEFGITDIIFLAE